MSSNESERTCICKSISPIGHLYDRENDQWIDVHRPPRTPDGGEVLRQFMERLGFEDSDACICNGETRVLHVDPETMDSWLEYED